MKVDKAPSIEPRPSQTTVNSSSATVTGNSKMSKFGMKTGFVIPKNKLSGSLVPAFRGAGKVETDTVKEETNKQIQRKTKWGTDLTQDAAVRRGRALAYQVRVEQITKQLESGVLEKEEKDHSSEFPNEVPNDKSSWHQADDQKLEMLKLEKREVIGEILKLNSNYKAPLDYEPLMKEASVPVPVKLYPGLNFVGLILGPGSNTQKRLEEETGARIRIQAIKAGSGEKVEITSSDKSEVQGAYEELSVHVSADTHEKVDAAVGLIELLVTPVSGRSAMVPSTPTSASGDAGNVLEHRQDTTSNNVKPGLLINQGVMQSVVGSVQPGLLPLGQFHPYSAPWFPSGPMHPPNNFAPPSNSSASIPNNAIQFPPSSLNPSNGPQFMVGHRPSPAGPGLSPTNPSLGSPRLQPPLHGYQWPHYREAPPNNHGPPPRVHHFPASQPHLTYPPMSGQANPAVPQQGTINQPRTPGPGPRQAPFPTASSGQQPNMQWSASTVSAPQPAMFQRPPVTSHSLMTSGAASSNVPANVMCGASGNIISHSSFPPRPSTVQLPNTPGHHPGTGPNFSFVIHQRTPFPPNPVPQAPVTSMPRSLPSSVPASTLAPVAPSSMMPPPVAAASAISQAAAPASGSFNQSSSGPHMSPVRLQGPMPSQSMVGVAAVPPPQSPVNQNTISVGLPSFTSLKPPISNAQNHIPATTPKPPRPNSSDFTFQPLGSPLAASQTVPRPSNQPLQAPSVPQNSILQPPPAPQTPSSRPVVQNLGPQLGMQDFSGTRPSTQMVQSPSHSQVRPPSQPFSGNPSPARPPPRFPEFTNQNPYPPSASAPHVGPQSFTQGPQMSNFPRQYSPQMMKSPPHLQQNQPGSTMRPVGFGPNQQYGNNPTFSSGRQTFSPSSNQVYDPFSPTSVASAPQQPGTPSKLRKQEDDPEYDDLMASVGVR